MYYTLTLSKKIDDLLSSLTQNQVPKVYITENFFLNQRKLWIQKKNVMLEESMLNKKYHTLFSRIIIYFCYTLTMQIFLKKLSDYHLQQFRFEKTFRTSWNGDTVKFPTLSDSSS